MTRRPPRSTLSSSSAASDVYKRQTRMKCSAVALLYILQQASATPPHIVMLVVDDLGFAGVGWNSPAGEPLTPHIDSLKEAGSVLQSHYTFKYCSPTRSSFLSGRLPLHVNQINRPPSTPGGGVPVGMTTVAQLLQSRGYATHHSGKWHGGMSHSNQLPINRGFNSSLAMLSGAADHFTNTRDGQVDMWLDHLPAHGLNGTYSLYRYTKHATDAIQAHDAKQPLFLWES
eukprot:TRINITY_DN11848_c0_g1_i2.p1 TRINITY_DN11848_c0_g1~~TRINITY_DN11848_c0_g1_i2.p1  ORF type:complete len:229 (+),score=41.00 TRINITY_DN11848_c0_g1_i2:116-802(+)